MLCCKLCRSGCLAGIFLLSAEANNKNSTGCIGTPETTELSLWCDDSSIANNSSKPSGNDESNGEKEHIPGTRRVWGTLHTTQVGAMVSTLKKLTKAGSKVRVYRKFRTSRQSKACWWFNLKGKENDLCALEGEWDSVTLHTNWMLEHYCKPTAVSNCNNLEPTPAEHDEHDELVQPSGSSTTEVSSLNGPKGRTGTVSLLRSCTCS